MNWLCMLYLYLSYIPYAKYRYLPRVINIFHFHCGCRNKRQATSGNSSGGCWTASRASQRSGTSPQSRRRCGACHSGHENLRIHVMCQGGDLNNHKHSGLVCVFVFCFLCPCAPSCIFPAPHQGGVVTNTFPKRCIVFALRGSVVSIGVSISVLPFYFPPEFLIHSNSVSFYKPPQIIV